MKPDRDVAGHFSRQAALYVTSDGHAAGEDLELVAALAAPRPRERGLDVATGAGHTALRLAGGERSITAVDLAPGMLREARRLADARGAGGVRFALADAHRLPFPDGTFTFVTCRIAPHHFADVGRAAAEIARVLAPGGRFVLEDSLAPEDPDQAAFLDELERRRDATHVHSLSVAEWRATLAAAGLAVDRLEVRRKGRDYREWALRGGLDEGQIEALTRFVLDAPEDTRAAFFTFREGRPDRFTDEKLICRAVRPG